MEILVHEKAKMFLRSPNSPKKVGNPRFFFMVGNGSAGNVLGNFPGNSPFPIPRSPFPREGEWGKRRQGED